MLDLSARGSRRLPHAVRRGLTFWRRSIQARVVASTVLLSTVVIAVVGWYLLQQTREGLLDHRVTPWWPRRTTRPLPRVELLGSCTPAPTATRSVSSRRSPRRSSSAAIPVAFSAILFGPTGPDGRIVDGGANFTPGLDTASVPLSLEEHFDDSSATAWTYTTIRETADDGTTTAQPGIVVGSQVRLPADSETYTLYYLFPLSEQEETLALVTRALLTAAVLLVVLVCRR